MEWTVTNFTLPFLCCPPSSKHTTYGMARDADKDSEGLKLWGTFDWPNVWRFALHLRAEVLILSRLLGKRYFSGIDKFFLCYETCTYTLNTPCHTLMTASFQGVQCQAAATDLVHGEVPQPPPLGIPDTLRLPNQDPWELPLQAIQLP